MDPDMHLAWIEFSTPFWIELCLLYCMCAFFYCNLLAYFSYSLSLVDASYLIATLLRGVCSTLKLVQTLVVLRYTALYCVLLHAEDTKISSQGFSSLSTMSCTLYVRMILPIVWWTLSNMELACGFLEVIGFCFDVVED